MIDPKLLREDAQAVATLLKKRGFQLDVPRLTELESQRKTLQMELQALQNERNVCSKTVGQVKSKGGDASDLLQQLKKVGDTLTLTEEKFSIVQNELKNVLSGIPNIPHPSVPEGKNENDNTVIRTWGTIPHFNFTPKDHVDLGAPLGMDFALGSKLSGARFVVLKNPLARLQRALIQFMLDVHTKEHGYQEIYVPYIVNSESLFGTGQLPKFKEDQFSVNGDSGLFLIPTAEVPVTNLMRDDIVDRKELPIKYVCYSSCFRSEAGSYGKDTRGMIRNHQFEKVELVQIVHPENSYVILEELTSHAEKILQKLTLPYRVIALCGGDIGFSAAKTYDLEVWLPSQNRYREISSCSNFESFQARRLQARFRDPKTGKPELVHTLNGSGLAVGRTLVAILENFQDAEGHIHIPAVLQPYFDGVNIL